MPSNKSAEISQEFSTGLRIVYDERSRAYPVSALLSPDTVAVSKRWNCYSRLDQNGIGACVGFAWANELAAEPVVIPKVTNQTGFDIYYAAQKIDEWPGENYEGTSILAGAKVVQQKGYIKEYRWAFSIDDVINTISQLGPVIFGIPWYNDMFTPKADGEVTPTGVAKGGHAFLGEEVDIERRRVWGLNQWNGENWGVKGRFYMTFENFAKVLGQGGQCLYPVSRIDPNPEPVPPSPPSPVVIPHFVRRHVVDEMSDGSKWYSDFTADPPNKASVSPYGDYKP